MRRHTPPADSTSFLAASRSARRHSPDPAPHRECASLIAGTPPACAYRARTANQTTPDLRTATCGPWGTWPPRPDHSDHCQTHHRLWKHRDPARRLPSEPRALVHDPTAGAGQGQGHERRGRPAIDDGGTDHHRRPTPAWAGDLDGRFCSCRSTIAAISATVAGVRFTPTVGTFVSGVEREVNLRDLGFGAPEHLRLMGDGSVSVGP